MSKQELAQLYYLNQEIGQLQNRLAELEHLATSCTTPITGMPSTPGVVDKLAGYVAEITDLKALLDLRLKKCFYELNRLNSYIQNLSDSEMRLILSLRYINGLSWTQIATSIGGGNSDKNIQMKVSRFLSKN